MQDDGRVPSWKIEILPLAVYVSYAGFSPLQCPAAQTMLQWHQVFPASLLRDRCCCRSLVFRGWSFPQSASGKETLPAWVTTLLWVLASSSFRCAGPECSRQLTRNVFIASRLKAHGRWVIETLAYHIAFFCVGSFQKTGQSRGVGRLRGIACDRRRSYHSRKPVDSYELASLDHIVHRPYRTEPPTR